MAIVVLPKRLENGFRSQPEQMPVLAEDFAACVAACDQSIDEILGTLSPCGLSESQKLTANKIAALERYEAEKLRLRLAARGFGPPEPDRPLSCCPFLRANRAMAGKSTFR